MRIVHTIMIAQAVKGREAQKNKNPPHSGEAERRDHRMRKWWDIIMIIADLIVMAMCIIFWASRSMV